MTKRKGRYVKRLIPPRLARLIRNWDTDPEARPRAGDPVIRTAADVRKLFESLA